MASVQPTIDRARSLEAILGRRGIPESVLDQVRRAAAANGDPLDVALLRLGRIAEDDLARALAEETGAELLSLVACEIDEALAERLKPEFLRHARAVPLVAEGEALLLAMANPLDLATIQAVRLVIRRPVRPAVMLASEIDRATERLVALAAASGETADAGSREPGEQGLDRFSVVEDAERLKDLASDKPVIQTVNRWIVAAVERRASDIHIEPGPDVLSVRYRLDGVLAGAAEVPMAQHAAIISRLKILARLDIAERRLPQDGRMSLAVRGQDIDFRVSIVPTVHGESVVLRVLDRSGVALDFAALGFTGAALDRYLHVLDRPHGIVLITGPTGSGKSTTLYTSLLKIRRPEQKILTVEDPVEIRLPGIHQTQVQPQIGLTFANVLRSFLRHDPDVILVGEIRDTDTARIAVQAALTGHLVLSTLHTNDAASSIARLIDMGVEDYLLTATINGLVGQRLVRRLCTSCREPYTPSAEIVERFDLARVAGGEPCRLWHAPGCPACAHTGFRGRTAIHEVLVMTQALAARVMRGESAAELQRAAEAEGMETMAGAGIRMALQGVTTLDEVIRVTRQT